ADSGGTGTAITASATSQVIVSSGVTYTVSGGQTDIGDIILSGGTEIVLSGGTISTTTVSGGVLELLSGSFNNGATISSGGTLEFFGTVTQSVPNTTLSGATVEIGSGYVTQSGSTFGLGINNGVTAIVLSGGTNTSAFINSGGTLILYGGATNVSGTTSLNSGATVEYSAGFDAGRTYGN